MPSMVALLGLLALAGYQNRDKLREMLGEAGAGGSGSTGTGGRGGLGDLLGGRNAGEVLSGGLGELLERLRRGGQRDAADSWVRRGPNQTISPEQLEQVIGSDVLATLSERTGLSREELLARLARDLPDAVDKFTPEGRVPNSDEAARLV
jgi:uncharacterized protein YidB (DUF937 family)